MGRSLNWTQVGTAYAREFTSAGRRATYFIDLDQPPIDRWALFIDSIRVVDGIYYLPDAKRIADTYESPGDWG